MALSRADEPDRRLRIKGKILKAKWLAETGQADSNKIVRLLAESIQLSPKEEKGYFELGRFYDKILQSRPSDQNTTEAARQHGNYYYYTTRKFGNSAKGVPDHIKYLSLAIRNYAFSLKYGHAYLNHSLPRMLTLWLDNGEKIFDNLSGRHDDELQKVRQTVHEDMDKFANELPLYVWMSGLSQLVSNICHKDQRVYRTLHNVLGALLSAYPSHAYWSIVSLTNSSYQKRVDRVNKVIKLAISLDRAVKKLVGSVNDMTMHLLKLANHKVVKGDKSMSLRKVWKSLDSSQLVDIVMPTQKQLTVQLPLLAGQAGNDHEPFPCDGAQVCIQEIQDNVKIMPSLVMPKRFTIQGTDGVEYWFLCKPKDDLRKDARFLEFSNMLSRIMQKHREGRRRKLRLRTYAVVPLNEECGLIEWVQNTVPFRLILSSLFTRYEKIPGKAEIESIYRKYALNPEVRFQQLIIRHRPVFYRWFLEQFPEPSQWFEARLAYIRSTALMSMVGHITGLGDRHGENILYDATTGECVHVDFNCLFWKGLTFMEPELVPFRLTQNMVDAFGVTREEGVYRKVCEFSLGILRQHREALLSVLEAFVSDPLVEWTKDKTSSSSGKENPEARNIVEHIDKLLRGRMGGLLPMSVEGQVHKLVRDATDPAKLSKMYIGWSAWL